MFQILIQADDGIAFHLPADLAQIKPVRGSDACRRNLTLANGPSDGIRAHANEDREFFDRQIRCFHGPSLVLEAVLPYAGVSALGIRLMDADVRSCAHSIALRDQTCIHSA